MSIRIESNNSGKSDAAIVGLVNFAYKHAESNVKIGLWIHEPYGKYTYGCAETIDFLGFDLYYIHIVIAKSKNGYPKDITHRNSLKVVVKDWQEEFLVVLSHELRHIEQFGMDNPPYHSEVDAEKYALKILEKYKNKLAKTF